MPIPNGNGGWQVGTGNPNEATLDAQNVPVAYTSTSVTLSTSDLVSGLISSSNASSVTLTLPLGTSLDSGIPSANINVAFDFFVINLGAGTTTVAANTGTTVVGYMALAQNVSGHFRALRTAVGTWVVYRIS